MGKNEHQPNTQKGKELMAHELTHTLQQKKQDSQLNRSKKSETSQNYSALYHYSLLGEFIPPESGQVIKPRISKNIISFYYEQLTNKAALAHLPVMFSGGYWAKPRHYKDLYIGSIMLQVDINKKTGQTFGYKLFVLEKNKEAWKDQNAPEYYYRQIGDRLYAMKRLTLKKEGRLAVSKTLEKINNWRIDNGFSIQHNTGGE